MGFLGMHFSRAAAASFLLYPGPVILKNQGRVACGGGGGIGRYLLGLSAVTLAATTLRATSTTTAFATWTNSCNSFPQPPPSSSSSSGSRSMSTLAATDSTHQGLTTTYTSSCGNTKFTVYQFPCLQDNYGFLLHNAVTGETVAIDAPDAAEILKQVQKLQPEQQPTPRLTHLWNTHHHWDHTGGNNALYQATKGDIQVYGPASESIPHCTIPVNGGDWFDFGDTRVHVMDVGGHTKGHIAYYIPSHGMAFVGDAMFALGCGRMFEGTPDQFWKSLLRLRDELPNDTIVFCAHEYTLANARFALSVEPSNAQLVARVTEIQKLRAHNQPTVPTTIGIEKETNPFLRCDVSAEIRKKVGGTPDETPEQIFAKVRRAKDQFRG